MVPVCLCCGGVLRALRRLVRCWDVCGWFVGGLCSGGVSGCGWCFVGSVNLALFGGRRLSCFSRCA